MLTPLVAAAALAGALARATVQLRSAQRCNSGGAATGVRVRFSQRGELPARVELKIDGQSGKRVADVVWQETHDAGLKFVG